MQQLLPCNIKGFLNFCLNRPKQISTHFFQQLCQQYKQPILKIIFVDLYEIYQSLQEHAEHLQLIKGRSGKKKEEILTSMLNSKQKQMGKKESEAQRLAAKQKKKKKKNLSCFSLDSVIQECICSVIQLLQKFDNQLFHAASLGKETARNGWHT